MAGQEFYQSWYVHTIRYGPIDQFSFVRHLNQLLMDLSLVETNKPKVIDPDDVIVRVTGSTICGSDVHLYHGEHRL